MYKWQKVKAMNAQGIGIKKIARTLKISKNTVRNYLRSNLPPEFHPRCQLSRKLTHFFHEN